MRATPTIIMLALASSACYQYFPIQDTDPLPEAGTEVRIRLESPEALDWGTMTINDVSTVEGHVRRSSTDSLSLFSNQLRTFYGFRQLTNGAVFDFERSQFTELEQRKMVPWKTGVAIGVSTVGLAILMQQAISWGGGSEDGGTPNEPKVAKTANIPFLKIILPLLNF